MTYLIGIDIAKYIHDCFIMDHKGEVIRNSFSFYNDKASFDYLYSILDSLDPSYEKRIGLAKNTIGNENPLLVYELEMFLDIYSYLNKKIIELELIISNEFSSIKSHIQSIGGIGLITAAFVYSEYENIEAFHTPNQILAFAGLESLKDALGTHDYSGRMVLLI